MIMLVVSELISWFCGFSLTQKRVGRQKTLNLIVELKFGTHTVVRT